jgi:hypothetical protein
MNDATDSESLTQLRAQVGAVEHAIRESVRDAVRLHKRAGQPMVVWRDGRVVWLSPDELPDYDRSQDG